MDRLFIRTLLFLACAISTLNEHLRTMLINFLKHNLLQPDILNAEEPIVDAQQYEPQQNAPSSDSELAAYINRSVLNVYSKFISEDGRHVDYAGMQQSPEFKQFVHDTSKLKQVRLANLSEDERKAFFLNIYNALVIHAYVARGFPSSAFLRRIQFFQSKAYQIDSYVFTLDDIEHGILRQNSKHPFSALGAPFNKTDDARLKFCIPTDPRIHFALVCGAKSCPPIRIFTPTNLERGLAMAAKAFCNDDDNVNINVRERKICLSQIFNWYSSDFGENEAAVLRYISGHLDEPKKSQLLSLLEQHEEEEEGGGGGGGGYYTVVYSKYDWSVNGSSF